MDDAESEININNHINRCRLCLKLIGESDVFYKINEITKMKFENLTSLEFSLNEQLFSSLICVNCNRDINKFNVFREGLIRKQTKLYEVVYAQDDFIETCGDSQQLEQEEEEDVIVQEMNEDEEVNEEMLDEEMLECDQFFVDEVDDGETLQVESLVEEIDGNDSDPVVIVEKGELKKVIRKVLTVTSPKENWILSD